MAKRLRDITSMYNSETAYPDLIIELHDGRSIRVHKAILFQANSYFERICDDVGVIGDRTTVGKLHLKYLSSPEAAAAVIALVRIIYGFPLPAAAGLTWPVWFHLAIHAQQYLEPEVGGQAVENFKMSALQQTDSNEVIKITEKLDGYSGMVHDDLVETIRKHHAVKLLRNKAYRKELSEHDSDTLDQLIDYVVDMVEENSMDS